MSEVSKSKRDREEMRMVIKSFKIRSSETITKRHMMVEKIYSNSSFHLSDVNSSDHKRRN